MNKTKWNYIKEIRKEQGLSVEQLANLSGLSKSSISDIENYKHIPSQISIISISHSFGLPAHKVFNLDYHILDKHKRSL